MTIFIELRRLSSLVFNSVGGVTVSMVAFQAVDPGSTPGRRINFVLICFKKKGEVCLICMECKTVNTIVIVDITASYFLNTEVELFIHII